MRAPEIVRERYPSTPSDLAFELAISWRDYQMAQIHYQQIVQLRLDSEKESLLGLEAEIGEALELQKAIAEKHLRAFEKLSQEERQHIEPERRLECLHIVALWERKHELAALIRTPEQERER